MQLRRFVAFAVVLGILCAAGAASAKEVVYFNDLSSDPGWTAEGGWQWGTSDGTPDTYCCVLDPYSLGGMYGHALGATYTPSMSPESLTTTAIDCTGISRVSLGFELAYGLCSGDYAAVEVSNDGEAWTTVWSTGCGRNGWSSYEFDISAIADNQPTVYVRWVLGPTDGSGEMWGMDIDDVTITGDSPHPPLNVLIWTPYSRDGTAYPNLRSIVVSRVPHVSVTDSWVEWTQGLDCELEDVQVLLVGTPDWMWGLDASGDGGIEDSCLAECGSEFAGLLNDFVTRGGTVIFCGETMGSSGLMRASGLVDAQWAGTFVSGEALTPVAPDHPLLAGVSGPITSQYLTNAYSVGSGAHTVLADGAENAVMAYRDQGLGAAVALGYSYDTYDENAAALLANAVQYPRSTRKILLYDTSNNHSAAEALLRLRLPYTPTGPAGFAALLDSQSWDAVLVDNPAQDPGSWSDLQTYITNDGRVAVSTGDLNLQPDLQAALGVFSAEPLDTIPPVYWTPEGAPLLVGIPEPQTWSDNWAVSGFCMQPGELADFALAAYVVTPTSACQAALVVGNSGRTLVHGFLWDERNQDADADGVQDVVQLIMREVQHLLAIPKAGFSATPTAGGVPLEVTFTDLSAGSPACWCWDFGDESGSSDQNPVHEYTAPGRYAVTLWVANDEGDDQCAKTQYIIVVEGAPTADFSADPGGGAWPLEVQFTDFSVGDPTSWAWTFGDGSTSTQQHPTHTYARTGTYDVTLTATNAAGDGVVTKAGCISVTPPVLTAAFAADTTSGFPPLVVQFTDQSVNGPTSWLWNFGDGGASTLQNPVHVYLAAGSFSVALTVANAESVDTETKTEYIVVGNPAPVADFFGAPTTGIAPLAVSFADLSANGPTAWAWEFGDGGTSTAQNPTHIYGAGTYTVTLTATNGAGEDSRTRVAYVSVSPPLPAAAFSASQTSGLPPLAVEFTDETTNGPTAWSWTFGDGGVSTVQHPAHTYTGAGAYTVSLVAANVTGSDTETKAEYITVARPASVADFSGTPTSGTAPLEVTFIDLSTNSPTAWSWEFGDGGTSTAQNPAHTYTARGVYTVTLSAGNAAGGDARTRVAYISVSPPAVTAAFAADTVTGLPPLAVEFTDQTTNDPTSWAWTFGDDGTSTLQNPAHVYAATGTYTVSLTAENSAGSDTETKEGYIVVGTPAPMARFSGVPTYGKLPLLVQFADESLGHPTAWSWSFGDESASTVQNPSHTYAHAGSFTVSLMVTNAGGSDTATRTRYVSAWFTDASFGYWAFAEIEACVEHGIVGGYGDDFRPETVLTRDQMAVFFARALCGGEASVPPGPGVASFTDVPTDYWAFNHIEYCRAEGIVQGYWDGYHPLEPINRAQAAVFSARTMAGGESGLADYTPPAESPFSDVAVDFWAYKYIGYCYDHDLVGGYPDGTYHPDEVLTRAQMAVFIARTFGLL